ncbi:Zn-ribbon domain-containing OB-fold protein [Paraburkholderia phenoliruptrix]|uniref:Zn-ribbon domain-containing OB-fold protein n=1 Tax=Paraburkholderia phenoliruptrix TaxID=252970 RepID=UPI001C6E9F5E|nr:OB-fold domain-containing protein [Paraburkholderia phenoliruptrix]MBW9107429.1 OB-fold domain-containing protein [Paraburkholderia phenoliruptrix]MBW9128149.1 OB-fold domain-containing protein [Paraburkholderia ginsengiterrae]
MSETTSRLLPRPTPETAHFWEGTRRKELLLQRCVECEHIYFPPRPFCPCCSSQNVAPHAASGLASLLSYVISAKPAPGIEAPYSIAVVELEEGPTMMTNVINCPQTPEHLVLDMPLRVSFVVQNDEITLPFFEPRDAE